MVVMDNSQWRFVVTSLSGSTTTSGAGIVLEAKDRQWGYHLNAGKTAQFTIPIDSPSADFLLSHDALLKVYRRPRNSPASSAASWTLLMVGDVIHVEEDALGDMGTVTVVAADPWWRFQRRLIGNGMDSYGRGTGYIAGTNTSPANLGGIILLTLTSLNGTFPTGVQVGTLDGALTTTGYIGPVYFQFFGNIIQQICNTLGGPDLELIPLEPSGTWPNTIIGELSAWANVGVTRSNVAFEYGMGKHNVQNYSRILSKDNLANSLWSPAQGFPSLPGVGDATLQAADLVSVDTIGLFEDIIPNDLGGVDPLVPSTALRNELLQENLGIRKVARQQLVFTPAVNVEYEFARDYYIGDVVTARAMVKNKLRYNGTVRIYGVDISIDDNDQELPALTLIPS